MSKHCEHCHHGEHEHEQHVEHAHHREHGHEHHVEHDHHGHEHGHGEEENRGFMLARIGVSAALLISGLLIREPAWLKIALFILSWVVVGYVLRRYMARPSRSRA